MKSKHLKRLSSNTLIVNSIMNGQEIFYRPICKSHQINLSNKCETLSKAKELAEKHFRDNNRKCRIDWVTC